MSIMRTDESVIVRGQMYKLQKCFFPKRLGTEMLCGRTTNKYAFFVLLIGKRVNIEIMFNDPTDKG